MKRARQSFPYLFPLLVLLPALYFLIPLPSQPDDHSRIDALAPVELLAERFRSPVGVIVDQSGAVFVSDRGSGEIFRIVGGETRSIVTGLRRPVGIALNGQGRLLIVEEGRGRLLGLETDSRLSVLAQRINRPQWITVGQNGTIYISSKGLRRDGEEDDDDDDDEDGQAILRLTTSGQLSVFTDRFEGLQGIVVNGRTIYAAAKGIRGDNRDGIFQIPILPDGSAGPITRLTQTRLDKPVGIIRDQLGALYFSAHEIRLEREHEDAIGKISNGTLSRFASRLEKPKGLAFDGSGNLYVADDRGDRRGRILRFRAPAVPNLVFPS